VSKFLNKAAGVVKFLLPYIIKNWRIIIGFISGITITGILAGLGRFIDFFACVFNIRFPLPLPVIIVVFPFLVYGVIMPILRIRDIFKDPPYLSFTSMEYDKWKLRWKYVYVQKYNRYEIYNIRPVCKKCGCDLLKHHTIMGGIDGLYCPVCEEGNKYPALYPTFMETSVIEKVIEHKIENKQFTA